MIRTRVEAPSSIPTSGGQAGHAGQAIEGTVERPLGLRRPPYGFLKIRWSPMRRQRTASEPPTSTHSNVARPSGPLKLQVISQMPGALSTFLTRSDAGHAVDGSAACRSHAATKADRARLNVAWSAADRRR